MLLHIFVGGRQEARVPCLQIEEVCPCGVVLEHELQGLAVQVAGEIEAVHHVQLVLGHVHKVLIQVEGPDILRVVSAPRQVALV